MMHLSPNCHQVLPELQQPIYLYLLPSVLHTAVTAIFSKHKSDHVAPIVKTLQSASQCSQEQSENSCRTLTCAPSIFSLTLLWIPAWFAFSPPGSGTLFPSSQPPGPSHHRPLALLPALIIWLTQSWFQHHFFREDILTSLSQIPGLAAPSLHELLNTTFVYFFHG